MPLVSFIIFLLLAGDSVGDQFGANGPFPVDTVLVGDAGNAPDITGYGAVHYDYRIGKFEVTIDQYIYFLNTIASVTSDSHIIELWNSAMATNSRIAGIARSGHGTLNSPYIYSPIGSGRRPIAAVTWFNAARFCNWLHNGATPTADTETGSYTLNGATSGVVLRNPEASWWIPSENEWYKAAYYKGGGTNSGYWLYPTQSDLPPLFVAPPGITNSANYYGATLTVIDVGSYPSSSGPYGTFDQAGNVREWNDAVISESFRGVRGGNLGDRALSLQATYRRMESHGIDGFRVATVGPYTAPSILSTKHDHTGFAISWIQGMNVHVERTSSILGGWETVSSNNMSGSYLDVEPPPDRGFYRLVTP